MKEHAHLDTWLRLAEQAVSSSNPAHVTYVAAKEEQRKFEVRRNETHLIYLLSLSLLCLYQNVFYVRGCKVARVRRSQEEKPGLDQSRAEVQVQVKDLIQVERKYHSAAAVKLNRP